MISTDSGICLRGRINQGRCWGDVKAYEGIRHESSDSYTILYVLWWFHTVRLARRCKGNGGHELRSLWTWRLRAHAINDMEPTKLTFTKFIIGWLSLAWRRPTLSSNHHCLVISNRISRIVCYLYFFEPAIIYHSISHCEPFPSCSARSRTSLTMLLVSNCSTRQLDLPGTTFLTK